MCFTTYIFGNLPLSYSWRMNVCVGIPIKLRARSLKLLVRLQKLVPSFHVYADIPIELRARSLKLQLDDRIFVASYLRCY